MLSLCVAIPRACPLTLLRFTGGKDGYYTFGQIADENKVDTFTNYAQGFIDYLTDLSGNIGDFPVEEMSTRRYTNRFGCVHLENGRCGVSTDASGTFVSAILSSECQIPCGTGKRAKYTMHTQRPSDTGCVDCSVGTYNAEDVHYVGTCTSCETGKYGSNLGADSCSQCPDGQTSIPGTTSAQGCYKNLCPEGSSGPEGAVPHNCDCDGMKCPDSASQPKLAHAFGGKAGFYHGVASGDPLPTKVIIWTRYTPTSATSKVNIEYRFGTPSAPAMHVPDCSRHLLFARWQENCTDVLTMPSRHR